MLKIIDEIVSKFRTAQGSGSLSSIKQVYFGDPNKIPQDSCPCITVMPINTEIESRGVEIDTKIHNIEIRLIYNQKDFYERSETAGTTADKNKVHIVQEAIKIVEDTNSENEILSDTLVGILRSDPSLNLKCSTSEVDNILYELNTERGFGTFEVIASMSAKTVSDRTS